MDRNCRKWRQLLHTCTCNLPCVVLKTKHLSGSAICIVHIHVHCRFSRVGTKIVKDRLNELFYIILCTYMYMYQLLHLHAYNNRTVRSRCMDTRVLVIPSVCQWIFHYKRFCSCSHNRAGRRNGKKDSISLSLSFLYHFAVVLCLLLLHEFNYYIIAVHR